ncbi:MAG: hypothetical protein H5T74_04210 [Actinobacteria bacterium]|nr:hypothetical protein [Actinomycetota bacterium]
MSMRPIDLQSILSGVKETERVQRAHEVRSQQQAHDFEVDMKRREHEDPKTVHEVARGEASRAVARKKEEEGRGKKGSGRREDGFHREEEPGGEARDREGHAELYNGHGRIHPLAEEGPHDIVV